MGSEYVWPNLEVTEGEVRELIAYHRRLARELEEQAKKENDRAAKLEKAITFTTVTANCIGGRV